jgi:hypothetical protein
MLAGWLCTAGAAVLENWHKVAGLGQPRYIAGARSKYPSLRSVVNICGRRLESTCIIGIVHALNRIMGYRLPCRSDTPPYRHRNHASLSCRSLWRSCARIPIESTRWRRPVQGKQTELYPSSSSTRVVVPWAFSQRLSFCQISSVCRGEQPSSHRGFYCVIKCVSRSCYIPRVLDSLHQDVLRGGAALL